MKKRFAILPVLLVLGFMLRDLLRDKSVIRREVASETPTEELVKVGERADLSEAEAAIVGPRDIESLPVRGQPVLDDKAKLQAYKQERKAERSRLNSLRERGRLVAVDLQHQDVAPEKIIKRVGHWAIIESAQDQSVDQALHHYDPASPPVVRDPASGREGVFSGQFAVKGRVGMRAEALAAAYGLSVVSVSEGTRWAFLGAPKDADLARVLASLRADPSVESADYDVRYTHAATK